MVINVIIGESSIHGFGVFASRDIDAGETILIIDDSRIVDADQPLRPDMDEFERHCDYLAQGRVVLMRPPERYINSSCDPNSYVKTIHGRRHVIAIRAIPKWEEITYDYIVNCHGGEIWECHCGGPRCRVTIVSSFFELALEKQIEYLSLLDDWFIEEHRDEVEALQSMDSSPDWRQLGSVWS